MKGRSTFTPQEIAELRRLLAEKQVAERDRQKVLRRSMRKMGFYITDFVTDQRGFAVSDLDELIALGTVSVERWAQEADSQKSALPGPKYAGFPTARNERSPRRGR